MENIGLNNDISVGGKTFHVQTSYSKPHEHILSNVFQNGQVIDSRKVSLGSDLLSEDVTRRMNEIHREMMTEMEALYYIAEKVKTVSHAQSAIRLGLLFLNKNLLEDSIEQFHLALDIDPDVSGVYAYLGKALILSKQYEQAIEILTKGANLAPDFADVQNHLGVAHRFTNDFDRALHHFETALKLNPDYTEAHFNLGLTLLSEHVNRSGDGGSFEEDLADRAVEAFTFVAEKVADEDNTSIKNAIDLILQNAYHEALEKLNGIRLQDIFNHFFNFENEFYLKFMYGGKGKDDGFIADYVNNLKEIIADYPDFADLRNALGTAYLIQCRNLFLKSLEEFRTALKINPEFKKADKNLKLAENDGKGFLILLRAILK